MSETQKRIVLIAGPTASGKSGCAIKIAQALDGEVINADSMQVYKELELLTARPDEESVKQVPHRLYGSQTGAKAFSVGEWLEVAGRAIEHVWGNGKLPVVVGGTGLYFKALEEGLSSIPDIPTDIRSRWRERLAVDGAEALHEELIERSPKEAAITRPSDGQRIVRALEVLEATGKPPSAFHDRASASILKDVDVVRLVVMPERGQLYAQCDARFEQMVASGALEEVRNLLSLDLNPNLPIMKAIGVRAFADVLNGTCNIEDAIARAQKETRNYAKRQMTWARNQMTHWRFLASSQEAAQWCLDEFGKDD